MNKIMNWKGELAEAHQIFYDETDIEISPAISRALEKILLKQRQRLWDGILTVFADNSELKLKEVKRLFKMRDILNNE